MHSLSSILDLLTQYGYVIIFPIAVVEGPIVAIVAGFLVSLNRLNGIIVFIIFVVGDLFGDTLYYALGRWSRRGFIERFGRFIGVTSERVTKLEKYFHHHAGKILLFGKTQPLGAVTLFSAGVTRMHYKKFMFYMVVGTIPKVLIFELAGIYFGLAISQYLNYAAVISFLFAVLLVVLYVFVKRYIRSQMKDLDL